MEEKKTNKASSNLLGIILLIFVVFLILYCLIPSPGITKEKAYRIICGTGLKQLSIAISHYKENEQTFPTPKQWSDDIQKYLEEESKVFICPVDKIGPCSYAMNENVPVGAKELPGDLVLLFESAPGWNMAGGADDVVIDRHGKPGANIGFVDGRVEFINAEDIPNLRWTVKDSHDAETE